ncbi:sensor domain-containing diguanylate cyclase [Metabacillus arenae]|uniref:Diguanylate cyclase n=1 Tax=Metabacillus arenae TaxID=2771434 RepID=A0A926NIJ7_9BACI|nr:diguanylate cyclase [Metabacillus arenae]MBD1381193.1 diguanylate cyclase [Metabacillus arenae]
MDIELKWKLILWACWGTFLPIILFSTYQLVPPPVFQFEMVAFLLLMCVVTFFPIIVNETPIFFVQGVSIAVFLFFGLFVEMIFMQISILVLMFKLRVGKRDIHRLPTNSLMFLIVSLVSGLIYYAVGGETGENDFSFFFLGAILLYGLSVFLTNHFLLRLIRKIFYKRNDRFITRDFLWEIYSSLLIYPVGVVLYFLYVETGVKALLVVGVPYLILSLIITLYYSSQRLNRYLKRTSEFGHQLTERLNVDEALDLFINHLMSMIKSDYTFVIDVVDTHHIEVIRKAEQGMLSDQEEPLFLINDEISNLVINLKRGILYKKRQHWNHITCTLFANSIESIMAVPVLRNQKVTGVVLLASKQKRAFLQDQLTIVELITAHLGVALENARSYEETRAQSERCPLTNVYNYRYLEQLLLTEFERLKYGHTATLSLILLDIDFFKSVNDNYGHQSGNTVLVQLAERLSAFVGNKGTVARYGGEEFVVLLPNVEKEACYIEAEGIRQTIANKSFLIEPALGDIERKESIQLTASIGFATAPYDANNPFELLRHADRAMLYRSQKGRKKSCF